MSCSFLSRLILSVTLASAPVLAQPAWWSARGAVSGQADDYSVANLGQIKYIATKAADELDDAIPEEGGAGSEIEDLVLAWQSPPAPGVTRDDYAALNQGQLKTIGELFYRRLAQYGYTGQPRAGHSRFPWTVSSSDDDSYALANLGQVKYVFSFLSAGFFWDKYMADTDLDGIPDGWEDEHGLDKEDPDDADDVVSGLSNLARSDQALGPDQNPAAANTVGLVVYTP